jgi:hypothetical protein
MMTQSPDTITRIWTCPVCGERIDVVLSFRTKEPTHIKVVLTDDMDARLHIAWHELCTCEWTHVDVDTRADAVVGFRSRVDPDCPVH